MEMTEAGANVYEHRWTKQKYQCLKIRIRDETLQLPHRIQSFKLEVEKG